MSPPIVSRSILVLGAGELGMPVIRNLAQLAVVHDATISVMLRPASMESTLPDKRTVIDQIRSLGVALVPGDLVTATVDELSLIHI